MILYLSTIIIGMAAIIVLNALLNPMQLGWGYYSISTLIFTALAVLLDAVIAAGIRAMPAKWFSMDKRIYSMSKFEFWFYRLIKVEKWKDKVPELGNFTNFHKNKVEDPYNNAYISRFILEACYGIDIHYWSAILSFLIIFLDYQMWFGGNNVGLTIGLPVAIINATLIVLPALILKWNLPRLKNIYKNNLRKEERKRTQK